VVFGYNPAWFLRYSQEARDDEGKNDSLTTGLAPNAEWRVA